MHMNPRESTAIYAILFATLKIAVQKKIFFSRALLLRYEDLIKNGSNETEVWKNFPESSVILCSRDVAYQDLYRKQVK